MGGSFAEAHPAATEAKRRAVRRGCTERRLMMDLEKPADCAGA
jgi:hypothetical protein